MKIYSVECFGEKGNYEHFGIFTTYGKIFQALQDSKRDSARITEFEMDKPNEAVNSIFYVYV